MRASNSHQLAELALSEVTLLALVLEGFAELASLKFLDPACGSGGMFVQAARYMHNHNASNTDMMKFRCFGVEKEPDTVKLAKMNLLLNNVRGEITEANSFYSDPYNAFGQFDYVMANPPFNVDEVSVERVKDDARFNTYGVPRNKSKAGKKDGDKKETVPNANYLWIGYFATALNDNGKAALVMANSASDAGGSEYEIRKKMIEEGIIAGSLTRRNPRLQRKMKSYSLMPEMSSPRLTEHIGSSVMSR